MCGICQDYEDPMPRQAPEGLSENPVAPVSLPGAEPYRDDESVETFRVCLK